MLQGLGLWAILLASCALQPAVAVKRGDFKTCSQSGFCRRLRDLPVTEGKAASSPYVVDVESVHFDQDSRRFTARVNSAIYPEATFELSVGVTDQGLARVKVDEVNGLRQRYNETSKWTLTHEPSLNAATRFAADPKGRFATLTWPSPGSKSTRQARITFQPLKLEFLRDGEVHVSFNEQNLFHIEHFRVKKVGDGQSDPPDVVIDETVLDARKRFEPFMNEDGAWEESFGGHTDSKPKGPEAYSFDITFPGYQHVFGIPQHASPLSLKTTRGGEGAYTDPYRLYNGDVFEYLSDSEMSIYGSIPFMHAHRADGTVAIFSLTGSENWIDITKSSAGTHTHWMAESGVLDFFIFLGPSNEEIFEQYGDLTGNTALPQMFAIGHHQCRWNYLNQEDVLQVSGKFDEHDIPMDVIWLDVEYAIEKQYFLWDQNSFSQPEKMQDELAAVGRQLVAIVDPHIKRNSDYYVYKEGQELDILYKKADGKTEYEGWCWPGSSSWTDFFNPKAFEWWTGLFKFDKFKGSRRNLWVWNDMNEPAIFNGPEITAPKDNIHHGGWEHRDIHNINGVLFHNATAQALIAREDPPRRPFVLSRSFFAGSQKYGAIWTGDNMGTWEHLAVATPMILSNSIAGMTFNGADVGGFFGNPDEEMLVRWYQSGAFHPFFRAHAHLDTKRREPYLFEEPTRGYLKQYIRLRYSLLPAWYTAFFKASLSGTPIVRPHYVAFPEDIGGFSVDDQYFVGDSGLLVRPVVQQGATEASVYLADDEPYYDYFDQSMYTRASTSASRARITVPAPISKLPLFLHGGSILTQRDIIRRAAPLMWKDPITLVIAMDKTGHKASGDIYLDDGDSFDFQKGELVWRGFKLASVDKKTLMLASADLVSTYKGINKEFAQVTASYNPNNAYAQRIASVNVDDIVIFGLASKPTCIKAPGQLRGLDYEWEEGLASDAGSRKNGQKASVLRIKSAGLPVAKDWQLVLDFDKAKACEQGKAAPSLYQTLEEPTCPAPRMYKCQNEGHIPACILLSRVNDGICDPECCDGSDERDGKVQCANRCKQVNKEYQAARDAEARIQRVGSKIRADWSKAGLKERAKLEKTIAKLEKEIVGLRERQQELKVLLERVEKSEASEIERKKASNLYKRLEEHQSSIASLRKHRAFLQTQIEEISALFVDLKKTFNPNYQDMAVLGAVRAFDDWRRKNGYEITEPDPVNPGGDNAAATETVTPVEVDFDDLEEEALINLESEDVLSLMSELETSTTQEAANLLFRIEEYLPDALRGHYDTARRTLLEWLANTGVISRKVVEQSERPDVSKARSAHQSAEHALNDLQTKLDKERELLGKDWGADWAWKKLESECIDKDLGEYTYELCWFKNARQKSNKGGQSVNLGKFSSWHPEKPALSPDSYHRQMYTGGQHCWNGPDRSVVVDLTCGTSNAIISVSEPEKCAYQFKVQTPAVCTGEIESEQSNASTTTTTEEGKTEL